LIYGFCSISGTIGALKDSSLKEGLGTYCYSFLTAFEAYYGYYFTAYFLVSTEGIYDSSFFSSLFLRLNLLGLKIACSSYLTGSSLGIYSVIFFYDSFSAGLSVERSFFSEFISLRLNLVNLGPIVGFSYFTSS